MKPYSLSALLLLLAPLSLVSCGGTPSSPEPAGGDPINTDAVGLNDIDDKYRMVYEIMPYSYADSNGDKIGDLKGIEDKIDYLADLNYTAIWMTPIFPSPTYHKYDATNYYDIDSQFGNMDAFDSLVAKAHAKGIKIYLDLAINHSSNEHEWFRKCCQARVNGDTTNKYYNYYNIQEHSVGGSWYQVPGSSTLAYEGQFWSGMPDFNLQDVLDNPNGYLAEEFRNIFMYWLGDHQVDGFRLDAVTSYFTNSKSKNLQFMTWLNTECKKIRSDCYLVGEGSWDNSTENQQYTASGIDGFFDFMNTSAQPGSIGTALQTRDASVLARGMKSQWTTAGEGIPANFIGNHDKGRLVSPVGGRSNIRRAKMGHSLLAMLPGAVYNYYGDETGQNVPVTAQGDPDIRLHVEWGDSYVTNDPPGAFEYDKEAAYPYGSVKNQLADPNSVVCHVRKVNKLRRQFPEIARGKTKLVNEKIQDDDTSVAVLSKETENSTIYLLINPSVETEYIYNINEVDELKGCEPVAEVAVEGNSTYKNGNVYLAKGAIVILKKAN